MLVCAAPSRYFETRAHVRASIVALALAGPILPSVWVPMAGTLRSIASGRPIAIWIMALTSGKIVSRWIVFILFGVAVAFAGCGPQGAEGPKGEKGDPGPAASVIRVVTGNPSVSCADNEILVSVVCAKGAPDGSRCPSDAVGLCAMRQELFTAGVRQLYKELLGREADASGLKHWSEVAARSGSLDPVRAGIMASEEYRSKKK
jgi:Domain of unknown function (DUF4214)